MGVRLYSPAEGRFATVDPHYGGGCSAYEYACADAVTRETRQEVDAGTSLEGSDSVPRRRLALTSGGVLGQGSRALRPARNSNHQLYLQLSYRLAWVAHRRRRCVSDWIPGTNPSKVPPGPGLGILDCVGMVLLLQLQWEVILVRLRMALLLLGWTGWALCGLAAFLELLDWPVAAFVGFSFFLPYLTMLALRRRD